MCRPRRAGAQAGALCGVGAPRLRSVWAPAFAGDRRLNPPQHRPRHRLGVSIEHNLRQHSRDRRRHFLRHLVGFELDQRIVDRDRVADLFQPRADDRLGAFLLVGTRTSIISESHQPLDLGADAAADGSAHSISLGWCGLGMSGIVTRATGASRSRNASSATTAAISAPNPPVRKSSWTIRQRRVRRTLSSTISRSHGLRVRRSITSALIPFRRGLAARHHRAPGDDGDPAAIARFPRLTERQRKIIAGPRPPRPRVVEHRAMFEENHRVVAAQGPAEQPDRILGIGRHGDFPAGIVDELAPRWSSNATGRRI